MNIFFSTYYLHLSLTELQTLIEFPVRYTEQLKHFPINSHFPGKKSRGRSRGEVIHGGYFKRETNKEQQSGKTDF